MVLNRNTPKTKRKNLRKFGLVVGAIFALLGFVFLWQGRHETAQVVLWVVGGVLITCGAIIPMLLAPIYVGWMKLAFILGWLNSHILLSLIFFIFFTPVGLIQRFFGRDALELEVDKNTDSYWIKRESISLVKAHSERQY